MSAQYDFNPGIDISGLSSVTQAQLLQMVAQLAPLSNIGGIVVGSTTPDTAGNPRFTRYVWLDNTDPTDVVIKLWNGTLWVDSTIADSSITAAKLANYAVSILNGSGASKIAYKQDGTADSGKSNYLVRLDAAGQYVEIVPAATVVNGVTINLSQLNVSAATNGYVLSYDSSLGAAVWTALSVSALITAGSISYDKLLNGSALQAGYLMRANPSSPYDIQLVQNNDENATGNLFALRSLRLAVLSATGATAGDSIRFDGTNWARFTPFYGSVGVLPGSDTSISIAHSLGAQPRVLIGYLKNISGGALNGYAANDIVDIKALFVSGADKNALAISADATNITISANWGPNYTIRPKGGGAASAIAAVANWSCYAYASL